MFPLFWHWAPQFFLPWSGSVKQDIELDRFFSAIPPSAGDGAIEEAAFRRASYGSQLGWITEVLLESVKDVPADSRGALGKLRRANVDIQRLKLAPELAPDGERKSGDSEIRANSRHGESGRRGAARNGVDAKDRELGGDRIAAYLRALRHDDRERYEQLSRQLLPLLQQDAPDTRPAVPPVTVEAQPAVPPAAP